MPVKIQLPGENTIFQQTIPNIREGTTWPNLCHQLVARNKTFCNDGAKRCKMQLSCRISRHRSWPTGKRTFRENCLSMGVGSVLQTAQWSEGVWAQRLVLCEPLNVSSNYSFDCFFGNIKGWYSRWFEHGQPYDIYKTFSDAAVSSTSDKANGLL